jgi:hypothetical protein
MVSDFLMVAHCKQLLAPQLIAASGVEIAHSAASACDERMPQRAMVEATGELSSTITDCSSGVLYLHGGLNDISICVVAILKWRE